MYITICSHQRSHYVQPLQMVSVLRDHLKTAYDENYQMFVPMFPSVCFCLFCSWFVTSSHHLCHITCDVFWNPSLPPQKKVKNWKQESMVVTVKQKLLYWNCIRQNYSEGWTTTIADNIKVLTYELVIKYLCQNECLLEYNDNLLFSVRFCLLSSEPLSPNQCIYTISLALKKNDWFLHPPNFSEENSNLVGYQGYFLLQNGYH